MNPAASQFHAWLELAKSDFTLTQSFLKDHGSPSFAKEFQPNMELHPMITGGLDLRATEEDSETRFVGLVQDRAVGGFRRVMLEVEGAKPWLIASFATEEVLPPPGFEVERMTEREALAAFHDHLVEDTVEDRFSGAVLIARHGEVLFSEAHGLADREKGISNTTETRFNSASMGKIFTAVATLQLVQRGSMNLMEPIGSYLPDYPDKAAAAKVTAHHLLTHTGGVSGDAALFWEKAPELHTLDDYMNCFGALGLEFEPGTSYRYGNYSFMLLGLLVQRVSEKDYYEYIQEHVFDPAELTSASYDPVEDAAVGYGHRRGGTGWVPNPGRVSGGPPVAAPRSRGLPAGGVWATVGDFKRLTDALRQHRLLDAKFTELMAEGKVASGGPGGREAYGWSVHDRGGVSWNSRTGSSISGNGELRVYPHSGYVVVVLVNMAAPAARRQSSFIGDRLPAN